jgi:hypothetical protein
MRQLAIVLFTLALSACAGRYVPGRPVTDEKTAIEIGRAACRAQAEATANKLYPDGLDASSYWKAERIAGHWTVMYPWLTFMRVSVDPSDGKAGDCLIEIGAL